MNKNFGLNLNDVDIADSGIKDYFNPTSPILVQAIINPIIEQCVNTIKAVGPNDPFYEEHLSLYPSYLGTIIELLNSAYLLSRLRLTKTEIQIPASHKLTGFLAGKMNEPSIDYVNIPHLFQPSAIRRLGRIYNNFQLQKNSNIKVFNLPTKNKQKNISITLQEEAQHWSIENNKDVYYRRILDFFNLPKSYKPQSVASQLTTDIIHALTPVFTSLLEERARSALDFLKQTINNNLAQVSFCRKHFRLSHVDTLLVDSSSYLISRIIAREILEHGGQVYRLDHGESLGFMNKQLPLIPRFDDASEFVTYSKKRAQAFHTNYNIGQYVNINKIGYISNYLCNRKRNEHFRKKTKNSILYMAYPYLGEKYIPVLNINDYSYYDFQLQVINHLEKQGKTLHFKPYPNSRSYFTITDAVKAHLGNRILYTDFEETFPSFSTVLLDGLNSSTLFPLIQSSCALIFINYAQVNIPKEVKQLLSKRIAFVDCWYDETNRAQINFDQLNEAFLKSPQLIDNTEYIHEYFS